MEEQILGPQNQIDLESLNCAYDFDEKIGFIIDLFKSLTLELQIQKLISIKGYKFTIFKEFTETELTYQIEICFENLIKKTQTHKNILENWVECKQKCLLDMIELFLSIFVDHEIFCFYFLKNIKLEELEEALKEMKKKENKYNFELEDKIMDLKEMIDIIKSKEKKKLKKRVSRKKVKIINNN